ncbi:MAG: dehydrogenase [Microbacteriaceae bacterium]|nr:dehydrogenase [Microbacteriaceae bacterium]
MKCAVVGIGGVALGQYLPALAGSEGMELGYLSRAEGSTRAAVGRFGGEVLEGFAGLAAWHPDVAFVTAADTAHHTIVRELIRAGVPRLYVEKPFVAKRGQAFVTDDDYREGVALLEEARSAGVEIAVGFNYRAFATVRRALEATADCGAVIGVEASAHYACWSHTIDLIGLFAGPIRTLSALAGEREHGEPPLRTVDRAVSFVTEGGAVGALRGTAGSAFADTLLELTVRFERGRATLRDLGLSLELADERGDTTRFTPPTDASRWALYDRSFADSIAGYLATVRAGSPPPVTGEDGVAELRVEAAIHRSLATHAPVELAHL